MSDLISKEEVKKLTKQMYLEIAPSKYDVHTISDCTSYVASKCRQYINEHLNDISPVEPKEWTSIKDGKPKKSGKYWVTIQSTTSDVKWVRADYYHVERDYFDTEMEWSNSNIKITAWQPINEQSPYKGGEI
jgi:hypothetical protein